MSEKMFGVIIMIIIIIIIITTTTTTINIQTYFLASFPIRCIAEKNKFIVHPKS